MLLLNKIFIKIGWSGLIIIFLFIGIYTYSFMRKNERLKKAAYVKGTSLGINTGVRGHLYLYYSFTVNGQSYNGNTITDFSKQCLTCCDSGNTVIVRYENNNPENNDLVVKLPENAILENDQ